MGKSKQTFLFDLEPGETVIFDGQEMWFAGVLDGKARLWPKEAYDMTWEQILALNKKLRDSPNGELTYMEFKAILEGEAVKEASHDMLDKCEYYHLPEAMRGECCQYWDLFRRLGEGVFDERRYPNPAN